VKEPCAATCASCPNAVKGSKITESGKQTTLCAPFKRVAIVPSANIGSHVPMLLRLAQTSVWDKDNGENEAKGWYAWDQYLDMLRARGAKHTATVETRVKFDSRMAYPKLLFSASRWLNPEEATAVKSLLAEREKEVADILTGSADRDGLAGQPTAAAPAVNAEAAASMAAAAVQKAAAPAPVATPAPTQAPVAAAPKPPKKPAATPAPAPLVKTMTEKAGQFTYDQLIAEGWDDETLIAEGMMVMAPAAPQPPAKPSTPKPPKKAAAAAPAAEAPAVDPFAAAASAKAAPAPAATNTAPPAATVVSDTPQGLQDLLAGWDDDAAT
jgi:hypothetical protein